MRQCGMTTVVPVSKRGTVTLPPELRRKFGFDRMDNPLVIIEERDGEMLLRPATAVPVRDLPKNVIEGWIADDEAGMRAFEAAKPGP